MDLTRRDVFGLMAAAVPATASSKFSAQANAGMNTPVSVDWLGGNAPRVTSGVSWGVPWLRGTVPKESQFHLTGGGKTLPLQNWTLAYWPDGSVKWTGFATVASPGANGPFTIESGAATGASTPALRITEGTNAIQVDTGSLQCRIPRQGSALLEGLTVEGREVARRVRLVCSLEDRSQLEASRTLRFEDFTGEIQKVTVEGSGPVRGVIKIDRMAR